MNCFSVSDPTHGADKYVGQLQVLHGFRKGNLVLLSQLHFLVSIGSSAGNVKQVDALAGQDWHISESVFQPPALPSRKPVYSRDLPKEWHIFWDIASNSSNDLDTKSSAALEASTPSIGPLVGLQAEC